MLEIIQQLKSHADKADINNGKRNKLFQSDRQFHDWYRFVLSFPPHLVRQYLREFQLGGEDIVLDPFCGTGTTLVEAKLQNISSIGIEANNLAHFASSVKLSWDADWQSLLLLAKHIRDAALKDLGDAGISDAPINDNALAKDLKWLDPEREKLILKNSISPLPLHKTLVLLDHIKRYKGTSFYNYFALALANSVVYKISNLRFGPEVGIGKLKSDTFVIEAWFDEMKKVCRDLEFVENQEFAKSRVHLSDSRDVKELLKGEKISAVITSPPYPNEKDYSRTTRLESVLLGFINTKEELRSLKKSLLRSNTRGVYKDDDDDKYVINIPEVQQIAEEIEKRRNDLGKTSGFEKLYHRVTKLYFGGIAKHLIELQSVLKPGAKLAYVVGDQASYLRVMIRTGKIIGDIAESIGYKLERIDLFRTRFSTATKTDLNEEVVILRWLG